jgi:hypothetical protein
MPLRKQPADEPYESRDLELGRALRSWTDAYVGLLDITLQGPLDAPGMDPTWILRMSGPLLEAEVFLFYGPHVDISAVLTERSNGGMFVGGEDGITEQRLVAMVDGLDEMNRGGVLAAWLRPLSDGSEQALA